MWLSIKQQHLALFLFFLDFMAMISRKFKKIPASKEAGI